VIFWWALFSTWQESIGPDSHRLPFSDIPPSPHDIIFHLFPLRVTSHNSVSPFPLFTRYKSLHHGHSQSTPATSPGRIRHSLLPAISCSKGPVGNLLLANLSVSLLICPPCPTGIRLLKTTFSLHSPIAYCVVSPENIFPVAPEHSFPVFSLFQSTVQNHCHPH
jgi:hypothetical protein